MRVFVVGGHEGGEGREALAWAMAISLLLFIIAKNRLLQFIT